MLTAIAFMQLSNRIKTSKKKAAESLSSLFRYKGRDMLVFCFFLGVSFGFWILQKLDDTFETDIVVPLELVGVPKGTIITAPLPSEVTVTVYDRGANLFNYWRRNREIEPIRLDFSVYDNGAAASKITVPPSDVQRIFQQQMLSSTKVMRTQPATFEFHYNRGVSRRVPVKLNGKVSTRQQNYLQNMTFSPDSVTIYAPATILDTIRYAYTEPQEITNLDRTAAFNLEFPKIPGVRIIPEQVTLTVYVDYYTEQTLKVPIVGLNFPVGISLKTFPATVMVKYRVGAANVRNIKASDFVLSATYEELLDNRHQKLRLKLKTTPVGVSHVRIFPSEVDYLLEQDGPSITIREVE